MNITINKTFYTSSTESLLIRSKNISKKGVKLGSFLQCSIHIFLWFDGGFWKINLRISWNHIMKNLQVKQVIIRPLLCWQKDPLLLTAPGIYPQIYQKSPYPAVLICKGSNKKQRRGKIISNFTKGETFHLLWQPSALRGNNVPPPPFLHSPKQAFLSLSLWERREHTWTLNWKETLLICFGNCLSVPYSHRQSRNRMINTFIIVNITPACKSSLENKSILVHSIKTFVLPSIWPGTEYTCLGTHLKEEPTDLFWKLPRLWYSLLSNTGRIDSGWWPLS